MLKLKAPAANNSNPTNSSKTKEEGELSSSSDDDEIPVDSVTQLDNRTSIQQLPAHIAQLKKSIEYGKPAKFLSTTHPSRFVGVSSKSFVQPTHPKKFEKSRVPFVISFSDDDSGSESEGCRQESAYDMKLKTSGVDRSNRSLSASSSKLQMLPVNARNDAQFPRKTSLNHRFVSSITKTNGVSSTSGGHVKNVNIINKDKTDQEQICNQTVHLNSRKLQDLRQLIAIRENELKVKATKQKKELASDSCKNDGATNLSKKETLIRREVPDDFVQYEVEEPERKRLKVGESHSCPVNSDGGQLILDVESTLALEKSVLEMRDQQFIDNHGHHDKESALVTSQRQKAEANHGSVLATNLPDAIREGTAVVRNPSASYISDRPVGTSPKPHVVSKAIDAHNTSRSTELHELRSGENAIGPVLKETYQVCDGHIPDNNLKSFDTYLNNSLSKVNISGTSNMDIHTLMEVEELYDKELEEAQEHRHKCEVEEKNALKAYRKAQRAMMEANSRCAYLYKKRELYSAHFRSCMLDNPSMFWSSSVHEGLGEVPNAFNSVPEVNVDAAPSGHQMESEIYAHNQFRNVSNVSSANAAIQDVSAQHGDGRVLAFDPSSEPDASTSDPRKDNTDADAVLSQSCDSDMSGGEDDTFPINNKTDLSKLDPQRQEEIHSEQKNHAYDESQMLDSSQDSLLLEASLRSQLFARLGIKNSVHDRGQSQGLKPGTESSGHGDDQDRAETSVENLTLSEAKDQPFDHGGSERVERTSYELPVQIKSKCHVEKFSFNYGSPSTADHADNYISSEDHQSLGSVNFFYPILRSAFGHMRVVKVVSLVRSLTKCQYVYEKTRSGEHCGIITNSSSTSMEEFSRDLCTNKVGFYSSNPEIDPLWPLCMYELRGKCNDDECAWQHVRDESCRNFDNATANVSKSLDLLGFTPPSYLVCSDTLKVKLNPYKSILARSEACCWQKAFSASFVLSDLLPMGLPSNEPYLHCPGARIESYRNWNRQSSYFHGGHVTMSQTNQHLTNNDESLEMALLFLSQEVNKQKGRIEALKVLARALEVDPTSAVLWIVYLHIYYCNQKSIGKDDMFKYAVEHNEGSYELWLMYINSREQLEDRLNAYETALSALSQHASSLDRDAAHASECILDLLLQRLNTFCVSGNIGKAIEKLYGLFPSRRKSSEPQDLFLSGVLTCLTIWHKCIFWICCVYLVVYKKLPDAIVLQFECQKELSAMEWIPTHLTANEKELAVNLMESAVDSLGLDIDSESLESETTLNAAHVFALNHVRCIAIVEGMEWSRNLLDKYIKLYPSCLELVLNGARAHELEDANSSCVGFENALSNWLEETPGVQCIWNQYAEFVLQKGQYDSVKKLMDRWFHSVWKVKCLQPDATDGEDSFKSPDVDVAFGLLNLSLYKLMQNDRTEALSAINSALNGASAKIFKHCVREHSMFRLTDGSLSKNVSVNEMLEILNGYRSDVRAFPGTELLCRKFICQIKKPRVQQAVSNMFSPVPSDFSPLNLVLEVWYGPLMLPQVYDKFSDLVDLVEAIMEILPANYQLAISLCKLLSLISNSTTVTSSVSFWASSVLVNALFQTVPVPPEYVWVEAASMLHNLTDIQSISESFHKRALAVYPFSLKLWESYLNLGRITGKGNAVIEEAAKRGIELC